MNYCDFCCVELNRCYLCCGELKDGNTYLPELFSVMTKSIEEKERALLYMIARSSNSKKMAQEHITFAKAIRDSDKEKYDKFEGLLKDKTKEEVAKTLNELAVSTFFDTSKYVVPKESETKVIHKENLETPKCIICYSWISIFLLKRKNILDNFL